MLFYIWSFVVFVTCNMISVVLITFYFKLRKMSYSKLIVHFAWNKNYLYYHRILINFKYMIWVGFNPDFQLIWKSPGVYTVLSTLFVTAPNVFARGKFVRFPFTVPVDLPRFSCDSPAGESGTKALSSGQRPTFIIITSGVVLEVLSRSLFSQWAFVFKSVIILLL